MDYIAIIISKLNGGGAERCAANLSIELNKRFNVILVTFDGSNIKYPYDGKLIDLRIPKSNNFLSRIVNVIRRILKVHKIKKKYNVKVSISFLDGPNLVNALSRYKEKNIVSIRNMLSSEPMNLLRKRIIKLSSYITDKTVCLSRMVYQDMNENFDIPLDKLCVIYNHVDRYVLEQQSLNNITPCVLDDNNFYIVTMGRLTVQKGQWHLIRAFKKISKVFPNVYLIIIGEGELKSKLKDLAINLGLSDRIIFTGYIDSPHYLLDYAEVFVFPSIYEGLGNVLLEALSFNLPVVSTDCVAGPREILAPELDLSIRIDDIYYGEYGVLVPPLDYNNFESITDLTYTENLFADAVIELIENQNLRKRYVKNSSRVIEKFSKENIIKEWEILIKSLQNEGDYDD